MVLDLVYVVWVVVSMGKDVFKSMEIGDYVVGKG